MWSMLKSFFTMLVVFAGIELIIIGFLLSPTTAFTSLDLTLLVATPFTLSFLLLLIIRPISRSGSDLVFTLADEVRIAEERMQSMLMKLDIMTHEAASLLETLREGKAIFIRTDRSAYVLPEYWEVEDTDECDRDVLMQFVVNWQPDYDDDAEGWRRDLKRVLAAEKVKGLEEKAHA